MSTTIDILVPVDQTEGTRSQVVRWLRSIGDPVKKHEALLELETDKVTIEVAAPATGILREILKTEHGEVSPGDVLGRLEPATQAAPKSPQVSELPALEPAVLNGEHASNAEVDAPSHPRERIAARAGAATLSSSLATTVVKQLSLSPAVRRLIRERNLDITLINGTGEGGRITVDDVLSHKVPPILSESMQEGTGGNDPDLAMTHSPPVRSIPHTAIRRRIANHMVQSLLHTAPHVTGVLEADLSNVITHQANHLVDFGQRGAPLTHTAYFVAAMVKAIRAVPESNSRWTEAALEIYESIHVGIATNLRGTSLVVPVLRNVESLDLFGIAKGLYNLTTAAQLGKLQREDVRGGTFTISNHGFLFATPIVINQPQSAILGVGAPENRAVVVELEGKETVVVRRKCYATLTFDHRVMDGYRASRFLETFVKTLREWPLP